MFLTEVNNYGAAVAADIADGFTQAEAVQRNLGILGAGIVQEGDITLIDAETNENIEVGYQGWLNQQVMVEATAYRVTYQNFIDRIGVVRPFTTVSVSLDTTAAADLVLDEKSRQVIYYYGNANEDVVMQGVSLGVSYRNNNGLHARVNGTFASMDDRANDLVNPSINTPGTRFNLALGHDKLTDRLGGMLLWRWQDSYHWQGHFASGQLQSFNTLDLNLFYKLPDQGLLLQFGANNLTNNVYSNFFGGPQIGGFYYIGVRYSPGGFN